MKQQQLIIKNAVKKFNKKKIISNLSLNLGSGDLLVVTGPSGTGKSTLLFLLGQLLSLDAGQIIFPGQHQSSALMRRQEISFLSSTSLLIPGLTVEENLTIAAALGGKKKKDGLSLLKKTGYGQWKNKYAHQLSVGEKQRCSLLMAIVKGPQLLLLDEPTSALDQETIGKFIALLETIRSQMAVVITTHNRALIPLGNLHLAMEKGVVTGSSKGNSWQKRVAKKHSIFLPLLHLAMQRASKEVLLFAILLLSFLIAFPLFYTTISLEGDIKEYYQNGYPIINLDLPEEQDELLAQKELLANSFTTRPDLTPLLKPYFPSSTILIGQDDEHFTSYHQCLGNATFFQEHPDFVVTGSTNRMIEFYGNYQIVTFDQPLVVTLGALKEGRPYVIYPYQLLHDHFYETIDVDYWPIEVVSADLPTDIKRLEELGIKANSPWLTAQEEHLGLMEGLSVIFLMTSLASASGLLGVIFLIVLILKKKRDQDLTTLFSLGATNHDLRQFLLLEICLYLVGSVSLLYLLFRRLLSLINWGLSAVFHFAPLVWRPDEVASLLLLFLGVTILFSFLMIARRNYLVMRKAL